MFNSRRIKDLERSVGTLLEAYTRLSERLSVLEKPVSPAKKRGRPAKKVEKPTEDKRRKFKVGDKVQILGMKTAAAKSNKGLKGIVTEIIPDSFAKEHPDFSRSMGGNYYLMVNKNIECWPADLKLLPSKRKYVRSGKYAKVTTKKK